MLSGNYRCYEPDIGYDITLNVMTKRRSYVVTLVENKSKFGYGLFETIFDKSPSVVISKYGYNLYGDVWCNGNDAFLFEPFHSGITYFFEKIKKEE